MRIISWNVNGIRAVLKKGFLDWLKKEKPDILCLQETKALAEQVSKSDHEAFKKLGYHCYWHSAERKGYSGVATFSREEPLFVTRGVPFENDEGRVIATEHGDFAVYNIYFPNGRQREDGPDPERLKFKLDFYDALLELIEEERSGGKHIIVSGDWNTAFEEVDLARPKENEKVTGFLPVERKALSKFMKKGWVDSFRHFVPASKYDGAKPEERDYTWWTYRAAARDRNVGWRIDYHFVNEEFVPELKGASILPDVHGSDHCPIILDLKR